MKRKDPILDVLCFAVWFAIFVYLATAVTLGTVALYDAFRGHVLP